MSPVRPFSSAPKIAVAVLTMVLSAACADDPIAGPHPRRVDRPRLSTSTSGGGLPAPIANATKYRDAGKKNATGRDGDATLTARALLDRSGVTTIDVTTGELDASTTAPGTFDKVQVKGLNPDDLTQAFWTDNYNSLRKAQLAAYTYTYAALSRGAPVQVQANISGIGSRVGVVTLVEYVKRRPDLAATHLQAPSRALPNVPVNIGATISELNTDVGARANCVLYVDGAKVDEALGIWVDAGGSVSCAFTQTFATPGTRSLNVAVEAVKPGDWDTSNNAVAGSIEVGNTNDFHVGGDAWDQLYQPDYQYDWRQSETDGTNIRTWANSSTMKGTLREQGSSQNGWMPKEAAFPFAKIEVGVTIGNATLFTEAFTNVEPSDSSSWDHEYSVGRYVCAYQGAYNPAAGNVYLQVCSQSETVKSSNTTYQQTWFHQVRYAGDVTYHSSHYRDEWYNGVLQYSYTWNHDESSQVGVPLLAYDADQVRLNTVFTSASGVYTAALEITLQPFSWSNTRHEYACDPEYSWTWGSWTYKRQVCWRDVSSASGKYGWDYSVPTVTATTE